MKATFVIIALIGTPLASLVSTHLKVSEPALMLLSGAALLALGALLRRSARREETTVGSLQ